MISRGRLFDEMTPVFLFGGRKSPPYYEVIYEYSTF